MIWPKEFVNQYINAKNNDEIRHCENKLSLYVFVPTFLIVAVINLLYFSFIDVQSLTYTLSNFLHYLSYPVILTVLNRLVRSSKAMDFLITIVLTFSLVFTVIRLYRLLGPTVWTISFFYILIALMRTDRIMLAAFSITLSILGLAVWMSDHNYTINLTYYVSQFISFAFVFTQASSVFYINRQRSKKITSQLQLIEIISAITTEYVSVNIENFQDITTGMLRRSSQFYQLDRACFIRYDRDSRQAVQTCTWVGDGISPGVPIGHEIDAFNLKWTVNQILNNQIIRVSNCLDLPDDAIPEKAFLSQYDIKSFLAFPVSSCDRILGILVFQTVRHERPWTPDHEKTLKILADLLADAICKIESESEINYRANHDALTGLPNRSHFNKLLADELGRHHGCDDQVLVMFIDLDSFKDVNDIKGHDGGDHLLKIIASRLQKTVADQGVISRFGGDEFLVMVPSVSSEDSIRNWTARVMSVFSHPASIQGQLFQVAASIGAAVYPQDGHDVETLIRLADLAMYDAKNQGKNRCTICSGNLKEAISRKTQLMSGLHNALKRGEMVLHYQPMIHIPTGRICALEALVRWQHPLFGLVPPSDFIPLAEESGLIRPLGRWVLQTACRQNGDWQRQGLSAFRMAVNISTEQFLNTSFLNEVKSALSEANLDPSWLELEITESTAILKADRAMAIMQDLTALGVSISIDDFGTRYSALSRLKSFPVNRIKMDRQFVHNLGDSAKDQAIARIIINLASNLGLGLVAEGIESIEQERFLLQEGCENAQGFYYCRPQPADKIVELLEPGAILKVLKQ